MKKVVIENIDEEDGIAEALREVAEKIEEGYTNGVVGWSGATWYIEEE